MMLGFISEMLKVVLIILIKLCKRLIATNRHLSKLKKIRVSEKTRGKCIMNVVFDVYIIKKWPRLKV